ncbi:MAG: hypothetical protein AUK35_04255 [Zetaproteobacteria bacterium CG2_30_46_52]|nr:MAG: hypothetical protein AUK35_04255 [Zetaproteobacteria bacterium CG2_30_46_52]
MMTTNTISNSTTGDASLGIAGIGKKDKTPQQSLFSRLLAQLSQKSTQAAKQVTPQHIPTKTAAENTMVKTSTGEHLKSTNPAHASKSSGTATTTSGQVTHIAKNDTDVDSMMVTKVTAEPQQNAATSAFNKKSMPAPNMGEHMKSTNPAHASQSSGAATTTSGQVESNAHSDGSDALATLIESFSTPLLQVQEKHTPTSASAALTTASLPISKMASSKSSKLEVGAGAEDKGLMHQVLNKKTEQSSFPQNVTMAKKRAKEDSQSAIQLTTQDTKGTSNKLVSVQPQQQAFADKASHKTETTGLGQQTRTISSQGIKQSGTPTGQTEKSFPKMNARAEHETQQNSLQPIETETRKNVAKNTYKGRDMIASEQTGLEIVRNESSKAQQALIGVMTQRGSGNQHQPITIVQVASPVTARAVETGHTPLQQDFASNQDDAELSWMDAGKTDHKMNRQNDFQAHLAYRSQKAFSANDAMLEIVRSAKDGRTTLELQLEPAHLGKVQVTIQMDASKQIQVAITMDQAASRQALEQHLPQLRLMLAQQGLDLGGFSMEMNQQHQEQSPRNFAHRNLDNNSDTPLLNNTIQHITRTGVNVASDGHISIMA